MSTSPLFSELISVQFDVSSFTSSLEQLKSAYQSFMSDLSESGLSGNDILGAGVVADFSQSIKQIKLEVNDLAASFKDAFASVGASSSSAAERLSTAAGQAGDSKKSSGVTSQIDQLEDLSRKLQSGEASWSEFAAAGRTALENKLNPAIRSSIALQEQLREVMKGMVADGVELTNKQSDFFYKPIQALNREETERESTSGSSSLEDDIKLRNRQRDAFYRSPYASNASETEERDEQRAKELESLKNDIISRSTPEETPEEIVPSGAVAQFKEGISGIKDNIGGMVANLVAFQLEWGLATIAMQAALAPLVAIRDTLKAGFGYMTDLQKEAADLQGVIASSVQFTADPFANFVQSGKAAEAVVKQLQDESVATGMSYSTLSRSFKAFETGGGQHLVGSLSEAVQLSNMFAMAMVAAGKDVQTTRMLMSDVPKLLDGSVTSSSSLLRVLGLTQAQWQAIRTSAESHHDLLQQLSPLMANYVAVVNTAGERTSNLENAIKLAADRTAALVAGPAWDEFLSLLEGIVAAWKAQQSNIDAAASSVGNMTTAVLGLVSAFGEFPTINGLFHGILITVASISEAISGIANASSYMIKNVMSGKELLSTVTNPNTPMSEVPKAWDRYKKEVADTQSQYQSDQAESANRLSDVLYGTHLSKTNRPTAQDTSAEVVVEAQLAAKGITKEGGAYHNAHHGEADLDQPVIAKGDIPNHPPKPHYDNSVIQSLRSDFLSGIQNIKNDTAERTNNVKDMVSNNVIDKVVGMHLTQANDHNQTTALEALVKEFQDRARNLKGANPKTIQELINTLPLHAGVAESAKAEGNEQSQIDKANTGRGMKETINALTVQLSELKDEISIDKQRVSTGGMNKSTLVGKQIQALDLEHQLKQTSFNQESSQAGANIDEQMRIAMQRAIEQSQFGAQRQVLQMQRMIAQHQEIMKPFTDKVEGDTSLLHVAEGAAQATSAQYGSQNYRTLRADVPVAMAQATLTSDKEKAAQQEYDYQKSINPQSQATREALQKLQDAANEAAKAIVALKDAQAKTGIGGALDTIWHKISGTTGVDPTTGKPLQGTDALTNNIDGFNAAVKNITGAVGAIQQGIKSGGVAGGVGAGLSSVAGVVGMVNPLAGAITGFAGTILSTIGGMFTAYAAHIAAEITRQFNLTMQAYQDNTQTASLTLQQVEQEKQQAISQLSGVKGGQDQLDKLLPTLNSEIAQLQQSIASTLDSFNLSMATLTSTNATGGLTGPIGAMEQQWASVNKQVQQYIAAGGDAATAYQYLSDSLTAMKQQAGNALLSGEQTAIQDALQLNQLLQQRIDLEKSQAQANFNLLTQDSVERRGSAAVTIGVQLQLQQQQNALQMQTLNAQITGLQQQVSQYQQIYNISSNTATLLNQQNELQSQALTEQINQLKQYAQIYQNIFTGTNGQSTMSTQLANFLNQMTFNFNTGQINSDNWLGVIANVASQAGLSVTNAIINQAKVGLPPIYQQQY